MGQAYQDDAGGERQWRGDCVNPPSHQWLGPSVHVETDLALHFRRGDSLDARGVGLALGEGPGGFFLGLMSDRLGLRAGFRSHRVGLRLQCDFPRLDDSGSLRCHRRVVLYCHMTSPIGYGNVTYVSVGYRLVRSRMCS